MRQKRFTRPLFAALAFALLVPIFAFTLYKPTPVHAGSCAEDPNNLLKNGTMAGRSYPPYGDVAIKWKPFVVSATDIHFENADNEGYDPNGSQYIWQDFNAWDAGIY